MVRTAKNRAGTAAHLPVRGRGRWLGGLACLALAGLAVAGDLTVRVTDPAGKPVADVVVVVTPLGTPPPPVTRPASAVLDQLNRAFVPQVLAVRTGTIVAFPNNDTINHQVYSFSAARRFQLPLYKGLVHPPLAFDHPGLVVLGCNIHDEMIGYVYVTDSAWYGVTDASGTVALPNVPAGQATLDFWGPRVADPPPSLTRPATIGAGATVVEVRLHKPLRARAEPRPQNPQWDY